MADNPRTTYVKWSDPSKTNTGTLAWAAVLVTFGYLFQTYGYRQSTIQGLGLAIGVLGTYNLFPADKANNF